MPKLSPTPAVSVVPEAESTLKPQLLIPCEPHYREEGAQYFPDIAAIKARQNVERVQIFDEFSNAILAAQSRVWIIDKRILSDDGKKPKHNQRLEKVSNWFRDTDQLKSVRILTGAPPDQNEALDVFSDLSKEVTDRRGPLYPPLDAQIKFTINKFPYIHDRFAIIDDELWHFGATVGGFHRHVNAASRGWDVNAHKAIDFFEMAWKGLSD
ncbi:hypothetical protein PMI21_01882 [Pseudomonas sp. GM18]|uniref:hypothetical protein n=1 Tax=Pseudomonas sp. GM18 TaxID=1144324 RepID=UPI000272810B|nr:hypothetical protein [Pseudomonas sp. GM18]EJM18911.1 hypothetical protein PMI21_01882 [Pseudomonas sp. GM18]